MLDPFIGQITVYPYAFPPNGWMDCAGQLLPISQYTALFSLLGTTYGGNGTSNFALPDLQGRVSVNQGNGPGLSSYSMGEEGGFENVTLLANQNGIHNHSLSGASTRGSAQTPAVNLLAIGESGAGRDVNTAAIYNAANPNTNLTANSIPPVGGTLPHNNLQPFLVLRFCIAIQGVYPSRS
jgi:microcystin-dependent protein